MPFDEILRCIRKQLGITQEQFAHELSVSFSTINRWENSHTSPSRLAKMRLVEYCTTHNIDPDLIAVLKDS